MTERLRALLDYLTDRLGPGPFHAVESGDKALYGWWLENAAQDSSFPTPEDVAEMFNALPALLDVVDAARRHVEALDGPGIDWDPGALREALARLEDPQ